MKIKTILILSLSCISGLVSADNLRFSVGLTTDHMVDCYYQGEKDGCNEDNELYVIEYNNVAVGTFNNSFYNRSYFVGYNLGYETKYVDAGAYLGIVDGYEEYNSPWFEKTRILGVNPYGAAYLRFKYEGLEFTTLTTGSFYSTTIGYNFKGL